MSLSDSSSAPIPVVLVHGLWMHPSSWGNWVDLLTEHGYAPVAPGWPLFQAAVANLVRHSETAVDLARPRGPLLLVGGGVDRTVPPPTVRAAHARQRRNPGTAHGDDDQIVPFRAAVPKTAAILKEATPKVYPGAPHGLSGDHEQTFNADLLECARG